MNRLNKLPPADGYIWVQMPTPDQLAEDAMAIHHMLDLLIQVNFPTDKPLRADYATDLLPLLKYARERTRRLGNDIDRLGRAG